MAEPLEHAAGEPPGILYYDPNPTTMKLATAGLRLAGYRVLAVENQKEAVEVCLRHGPGGDGSVVAILLDASADPAVSAEILRALVQLPSAADLPGILLVNRNNPTPIPGAEGLPSLKRPFSTPALVKVVRETLDDTRPISHDIGEAGRVLPLDKRIEAILARHQVKLGPDAIADVTRQLTALSSGQDLPPGTTLNADLSATKLEAVLEMLGNDGSAGVLTVRQGDAVGRLHVQGGYILLGESADLDEDLKLGRFVVEAGFMRDEQLEAFLVGQDPERRPLGTRLVEGGLLTPAELSQVLVNQAREITCHLLTWRTGNLAFVPTNELDPLAAAAKAGRAELLVAEALLDGLRRLEETAIMGPHMAQVDDVYLRIDEQLVRIGRHALAREELAVLELLNGRNSVKEIARKTRSGTLAIARVLYRLTKANLARRRVTPVTV